MVNKIIVIGNRTYTLTITDDNTFEIIGEDENTDGYTKFTLNIPIDEFIKIVEVWNEIKPK